MGIIKQKPLENGETWESRAAKKVDAEISAYHWLMRVVIGAGLVFLLFVLIALIIS